MAQPPLEPRGAADRDAARRERAQARAQRGEDASAEGRGGEPSSSWQRPKLTFWRLSGWDRSGPPPPQTLAGAPLNPWTIPNAIGFVRAALIPVFLVLGLGSDDGIDTAAAIVFAVVAWSDYLDGIAARVTGQYSRLGTLLDPIVDRLLVVAGLIVVWKFELLPRWAIAALIARELFLLVAGRVAMQRGRDLSVNFIGRLAVWPTMSAIFFALVGSTDLAEVLLYIGLAMSYAALAKYVADAAGASPPAPSSSA